MFPAASGARVFRATGCAEVGLGDVGRRTSRQHQRRAVSTTDSRLATGLVAVVVVVVVMVVVMVVVVVTAVSAT